MTANKEWPCNCIAGKIFEVSSPDSNFLIKAFDRFEYCPYCGKSRPEEPKALWKEIMYSDCLIEGDECKEVSKVVLKWFKENFPAKEDGEVWESEVFEWLDKEMERCK